MLMFGFVVIKEILLHDSVVLGLGSLVVKT